MIRLLSLKWQIFIQKYKLFKRVMSMTLEETEFLHELITKVNEMVEK
jgi:hypothetical protein